MTDTPFDDLPRTPAAHFRLYLLAAVARVLDRLAELFGSHEAADEQFPFLGGYREDALARAPLELCGREEQLWWRAAIEEWERGVTVRLPLRALREASALDHDALTMLVCAGLVEEDSRFGSVFEAVQAAGQRRPNAGLFASWWRGEESGSDARAGLRALSERGLINFLGADSPRAERAVEVPAPLWDLLRGDGADSLPSWARYRAPDSLADFASLLLPPETRTRAEAVPSLVGSGQAGALVVRGPRHNGRRTLVGAVARASGRGLLELEAVAPGADANTPDESRWRLAGPLAVCLDAMPVVALELAPGDTFTVPALACYDGPLGVVLGAQGGLAGEAVEQSLTLTVRMPARAERREHWRRALEGRRCDEAELIANRFRITGGSIRRAARLACVQAVLEGREDVRAADVREACRALSRETLETLATRVEAAGDWGQLSVSADTLAELRNLESRCRHREELPAEVGACAGAMLNGGVRALFSGASGTGKTFAARLLAASLEKDLYRLDLSSVVNKYIGETEKNLNRVFARAEELDVILLLDEGDALLAQRTEVSNANDRYANLETNYLLQRLENYEGILLVTTNAGDRIDSAFQRRMDVCVTFSPPDASERWSIWRTHLPASHAVSRPLLDEVARRCELTGGQIRNAVLHAAALALADGRAVSDAHVGEGVRREYRKMGAVCPLRQHDRPSPVAAGRW